MDALAKSLAPGFLVRCLFAGAFFLVALRLPGPLAGFPVVDKDGAWIPLSLIALVAGYTAYTVHRASLYPLIESWFSSGAMTRLRGTHPLIARRVTDGLLHKWAIGRSEPEAKLEQGARIAVWADSTQFLYASAWSVALGAIARRTLDSHSTAVHFPLVALGASLLILALLSDWRLNTVIEAWTGKQSPEAKGEA